MRSGARPVSTAGRVWRVAALVCLAAGLAVTVPLVPPGEAVLLVLAGVVLGGTGALLLEIAGEPRQGPTVAAWRKVAFAAVWSGLALLSLTGLGALSGWGATTIAVALVVTSPLSRRLVARVVPSLDKDVVGDVTTMSSAELCTAWRRTFDWLNEARHPTTVVDLAVTRQALLDELERRHPDGVQAWLTSVPVPGSDPQGFLRLPPAA